MADEQHAKSEIGHRLQRMSQPGEDIGEVLRSMTLHALNYRFSKWITASSSGPMEGGWRGN